MTAVCELCGSQATVHITLMSGKKVSSSDYCSSCYASLSNPFSGAQPRKALPERRCDQCGMTWSTLRRYWRFGCSNDYEVFGAEVGMFIEQYHGRREHVGKRPVIRED